MNDLIFMSCFLYIFSFIFIFPLSFLFCLEGLKYFKYANKIIYDDKKEKK